MSSENVCTVACKAQWVNVSSALKTHQLNIHTHAILMLLNPQKYIKHTFQLEKDELFESGWQVTDMTND